MKRKCTLVFSLMLAALSWSWGQQTVTGTVTADDGEPLIGVNILEIGSVNGTVTDFDGNYSLEVADGASLRFTYTGYATQEIPVGNQSVLDVVLQTGVALDEVVVTSLGISREKKSLTYAAQNVETEELSQARELNVVNSLSGKVAGLSIARSGSGVGSPSRVLLRGNRSIAGDSQPLYIVDGVPITGDITDVNPDDVESVSVLKGPNAAALYGNRANNGAIIITTKKGRQGFNVSLNTTYMAELPIFLRDYQTVYGQGNARQYSPNSEQAFGPRMDGQSVDHWSPDPNWPVDQYPFTAQPGNVEDFYQTGHNWATNLAINTGTENTQTYFSYTYTDAAGVVPGNDLTRHNAHIRITNRIADRLYLDTKLNYIREEIDNVLPQGENFANPNRHAQRLPPNISTADASQFEYTDPNGLVRQNYWNPGSNGGANPYWTINRNLHPQTTDRIIGFASLRYEFLPGLSAMVRTAIDRINGQNSRTYYADSYIIADNGEFFQGRFDDLEWNNDILLSYSKDLSSDWYLSVNVGANNRIERNSGLSSTTGTNPGPTVRNFFALSNTQVVQSTHNVGAPRDVNSVYGFAQLAWRDAIFLDITARNDWSSTLPPDNWSFFYPSFGLNVVLSDLIPMPDWVTFFKVRGSWAQVGNDTSPYQLDRTAAVSAGGRNGFLTLSGTLPNENLLPEETVSTELGFDLRLFRNRFGIDFTWYKSNSRNQLFSVALPVGSGASQFFTNGGDVENKGIEAIINVTPIETPNFSWDLTFNFTRNRSTVLEINDERPRIQIASDFLRAYFIEEGELFGNVYSRGFVRDDQGRVIVGTDGLPQITPGRTVKVANFNPDWLGGIRNAFRWNNFNLSFLIDIRQGGSTASITDAIIFGDGLVDQTLEGREGGVFGRDFYTEVEAVKEDGSPNDIQTDSESFWRLVGGRNAPVGEVFALDASNIRLRELVFGYRLPLSGGPLKAISLSLVGRNLFFFSNKAETLDPELIVGTGKAAEGFESFAPPTSRSIGFNLRLDF